MTIYGCIEAGGTKFIIGLIDAERRVLDRTRIDTRGPAETIGAVIAWLEEASHRHGPLASIGIASFGPVDLDRASPNWGRIARTSKPGWDGADIVGPYARAFGCPVGLDTDVNGAVIAEGLWGAARGADVAAYLTVGTGIGGGLAIEGRPVHGLGHPEMGHAFLPRHPDDMDFPGVCPFHGACAEGLASGPAIAARWGAKLSDLPPDHPGHAIIAFYLAHLTIAMMAIAAPHRIVLGGGVLSTSGLIDAVRRQAEAIGAGYFAADKVIVSPGLGGDSGLFGAFAIACAALD